MSARKVAPKPPSTAGARRFVALYDIHIGWEWAHQGGRRVKKETHNPRALKATLDFVQDFAPDVIIFGGDQINCGPVSHWHKGKPRLTEGFRLKDELDKFGELVLRRLEKFPNIIWLDGNHEAWIMQFLDENPGVEGLVEPASYLRLDSSGFTFRSQGEVYTLGKVSFIHGDTAFKGYIRANPARTLVEMYGRNIRAGHLHTYGAWTQVTPVDRQDYHTGVIVPALSARAPYYTKFNPTNFMQGFLYGWVWPDGSFTDYVVIINHNSFTVAGKRYHG